MSRMSRNLGAAMMSLLLATSFSLVVAARTPQSNPMQSSTVSASSEDKAKACNDATDKKGLTGQDRQKFLQSCLSKAADSGSATNASEQDKAKTCNDLADKKGLQGSDRRSFIKDCMKKANPN